MSEKRLKVSPLTFGRMVGMLALQFEVVPELMAADNDPEQRQIWYVAVPPKFRPGLVAPDGLPPTAPVTERREFRRVPGNFFGATFKFYEELP